MASSNNFLLENAISNSLEEIYPNQIRKMRQLTSSNLLSWLNSSLSLLKKFSQRELPPKNVKKIRNGNLLVEMNSRRLAENILKMKCSHTTKCRAYFHERLNTSKRDVSSRELALATTEEMTASLGKQSVTNIRRITIRKGRREKPDQHLHPDI